MAQVMSLRDAVAANVRDGDSIGIEGFTQLVPHAAGHELVRQGKKGLNLARMTPDPICDQLIGMGCARRLIFSWGGNPGVGSLHRFRDAVSMKLTLTAIHAGVAVDQVRAATAWDLKVSPNLETVRTPEPHELAVPRDLIRRTAEVHGQKEAADA